VQKEKREVLAPVEDREQDARSLVFAASLEFAALRGESLELFVRPDEDLLRLFALGEVEAVVWKRRHELAVHILALYLEQREDVRDSRGAAVLSMEELANPFDASRGVSAEVLDVPNGDCKSARHRGMVSRWGTGVALNGGESRRIGALASATAFSVDISAVVALS
jgi:hypothetical protein